MTDSRAQSQDEELQVVATTDERGLVVNVGGRSLARASAAALASKLLEALQEEPYARGVAAGRRAVLREVGAFVETLSREVGDAPSRVAHRPAPGLDKGRLDHFLRATAPPQLGAARLAEGPAPASQPRPKPPETPPLHADPPIEPPPARAVAAPRADGGGRAADWVRRCAEGWWDKAENVEYAVGARAEARAIAAELFEIAEQLRRGDHLVTSGG